MDINVITGKIIKLNRTKAEGIIQNNKKEKIKFKFNQDNIKPVFLYKYYKFRGSFIDNVFIVNNAYDATEEATIEEVTELFPSLDHNDLEIIHKTFNTLKIGDLLNFTDDPNFINIIIQVLEEKKAEIFIDSLYNIKNNKEYMNVWELFNNTNTTLDISTVIKIVNALKRRALLNEIFVAELIKQNPWIILQTDVFDSISQAIKIANNISEYIGYSKDDKRAIISYAIAITNMYMQNGHSYIPYYTLLSRISKLTKLERKAIINILNSNTNNTKIGYLIKYNKYKDEITEEYKKYASDFDTEAVPQYLGYSMYIPKIFHMERYIAQTLVKILKSPSHINLKDLQKSIEDFMKSNQVILTSEQKKAILSIVDNKIVVINGGAGTGKSTVIKAIKEILKNIGYNPIILAPTGVASQRVAPSEGYTIHRYAHIFDDSDIVFDNIEEDKEIEKFDNERKIIIVDEMSMITVPVFAKLLSATSDAETFIFVGDSNQLPPIGAGGVFETLIELGKEEINNIKTISLSKTFRSTNSILKNAEHVLNNEAIFEDENLHIIEANDWNEITQKVSEILKQLVNNNVKYTDIMVLSNKRGENKSGTSLLNEVIRKEIFGITPDTKYSVGDIVITTRNDYDTNITYIKNKVLKKYLSSLRKNTNRPTIFNGTIGIIDSIKDNKVTIRYENPVTLLAEYYIEELDWYIEYGFAITVHKAQGGQAKYIIFATDEPEKISREMLYTVLTRSKNGEVFLVGGKKENWNIKRNPKFVLSKLKYKILDELNQNEKTNKKHKGEYKKVVLID